MPVCKSLQRLQSLSYGVGKAYIPHEVCQLKSLYLPIVGPGKSHLGFLSRARPFICIMLIFNNLSHLLVLFCLLERSALFRWFEIFHGI